VPDGIEELRVPWLHGPVHDWLIIPGWLHQQMHELGAEHEHRPPETRWWLCPLRQCGHGGILHDGDGVTEEWSCCVGECPCRGMAPGADDAEDA
jgi:hypothetical protein